MKGITPTGREDTLAKDSVLRNDGLIVSAGFLTGLEEEEEEEVGVDMMVGEERWFSSSSCCCYCCGGCVRRFSRE